GRATALLLAREGARVVVADRRLDSARDTVEMITTEGGQVVACEAFDRSFAVNFKSAWLAAKHALPVMRQHQSGSLFLHSDEAKFRPGAALRVDGALRGALVLTSGVLASSNLEH